MRVIRTRLVSRIDRSVSRSILVDRIAATDVDLRAIDRIAATDVDLRAILLMLLIIGIGRSMIDTLECLVLPLVSYEYRCCLVSSSVECRCFLNAMRLCVLQLSLIVLLVIRRCC